MAGDGLEIDAVTKRFGALAANDAITVRIEPGEVYGLLGPNGAGKSTLVKQIIGLLRPDSGSIRFGGHDLVADPALARQLCAYLPQAPMPIESFRVREAVDITGRIRGGDRGPVEARREELLAALELEEWRDTLGAALSGGVRRLVGFAMVTVWPSPIVILDEPTNDVDPLRRRLLWRLVRDLAERGTAVLLVTHNVLEAEKAVDRLAIVDSGRILVEGTPSSLKAADRGRMRIEVVLTPGVATPEVPSIVRDHTRVRARLLGLVDDGDAAEALGWAQGLVASGAAEEYAISSSTLEDVYVRMVGVEAEQPDQPVQA